MSPLLSLFGLLFALFFGVGGATQDVGSVEYGPEAAAPPGARPAPSERLTAPPIVLTTRARRQDAVIASVTVETATAGSSMETMADVERVSVVRPDERVSLAVQGVGPTQRLVVVRRLGCEHPVLESALLHAGTERWTAPRAPGAYELEVTVPHFEPEGGGEGSATGVLGLLVDQTRDREVIHAARDLFVCAPGP